MGAVEDELLEVAGAGGGALDHIEALAPEDEVADATIQGHGLVERDPAAVARALTGGAPARLAEGAARVEGRVQAQGAGFETIKPHQPILLDYVFAWQGYIADHTRIFSLGALPDDLLAAHQAMLRLQDAIKDRSRPGVKAGALYDFAVAIYFR